MRHLQCMRSSHMHPSFQYRSRVTPFAAIEPDSLRAEVILVSIPQQGYPLCGLKVRTEEGTESASFNTAAGLPPLRQEGDSIIACDIEVSIPQQGYPLCGATA